MAIKISQVNGVLSVSLICALSLSLVAAAHYNVVTSTTTNSNTSNFFPIMPKVSVVEAAEIKNTDPLIGSFFKTSAPASMSNMPSINMAAIPTPPNIPTMPNMPTMLGISSGPHVSGVIMPNVAIINISGKSIVVKLGEESMLGVVEDISRRGVTIDGKFYTYKRN